MSAPLRDTINGSERRLSYGGVNPSNDPTKRLCQWCGSQVTGRRRTFCSQACVDELLIRTRPEYARKKVFERDRGVCAVCGLDTAKIESLLNALHRVAFCRWYVDQHGRPTIYHLHGGSEFKHPAADRRLEQLDIALAILGMWAGHNLRRSSWSGQSYETLKLKHSLWQADHINPVVEGGGQCGLDNLRTLCLRCHKGATAELAARRARERRQQRELKLSPSPSGTPSSRAQTSGSVGTGSQEGGR